MENEIVINMTALRKDGDAILISRLCMALNDLSKLLYLHRLRTADIPKTEKQEVLRKFTGSYISLLMTSHLVEAIDIVKDIEQSKELMQLVSSDRDIEKQWEKVRPFLPGGPAHNLIKKYDRMRNNLVFHYSEGKELDKSFDQGLKDLPRWKSGYFPSTQADHHCHFKFAEDLLDAAFMRALQEDHPKTSEELLEVGPKIMKERDKALSSFAQFGQLLASKYLENFKLIE